MGREEIDNLLLRLLGPKEDWSEEQIESSERLYKELIREDPDPIIITTTAVQSTNVSKIGYNCEKKILAIEFKGGSQYVYPNVEREEYNKLMLSESIGSAFHSFKNTHKEFKKLK